MLPEDCERTEYSGEQLGENVYRHESPNGSIHIEIDTIHGIKGQTHQATLLLETFFRGDDLKTILPYLKGDRLPRPGVMIVRRLALAYVAMSRPTHLVCLAMREENVSSEDEHALIGQGWHIERVH